MFEAEGRELQNENLRNSDEMAVLTEFRGRNGACALLEKTSDTFAAFRKAAQEKQDRERQLKEQQVRSGGNFLLKTCYILLLV